MKFIHELRKIKKSLSHRDPLIKIMVSKDNILHNFKEFKNQAPENVKVSPVLKSNAYGHGLKEVATIFKDQDNPFLIVDSLFEAKALRSYGISDDVLTIGYFRPEMINHQIKNVSYLITSLAQLIKINKIIQRKAKIHLMIDTGMGRQGIVTKEINKAIKIIKSNTKLQLKGVCSHFSDADNKDKSYTIKQIEKWNPLVDKFKSKFKSIDYFHISASSGVGYLDQINSNMIRLGIGLYGFNQSSIINLNLKPVLKVETLITTIRDLTKGESVGYGATFTAQDKMKAATIPFGYFEGYDRRLSNKGFVKYKNKFCPVLGRVSMNITSFDVTNISNPKIGDKVIAVSDKHGDKNSIKNMSKMANTIPYVLLIHIPAHLKRIVY